MHALGSRMPILVRCAMGGYYECFRSDVCFPLNFPVLRMMTERETQAFRGLP